VAVAVPIDGVNVRRDPAARANDPLMS